MISLHMFLPVEIIQELDKKVTEGIYPTRSEALRGYVQTGLKIDALRKVLNDPEKLKEFSEQMDHIRKGETIFEWVQAQPDGILDGFALAIEMEKSTRYKQGKLVFEKEPEST